MKNIIYLLLSISLLNSCNDDDFLSALPRGTVVAKTTNDFRQLLDDADNSRYSFSLTKGSYAVDLISDDCYADSAMFNSWTMTNEYLRNLYIGEQNVWSYEYSVTQDDGNWKNHYYIVSLVGTILSEIGKATDNPIMQKQLIAEARFHRAYAYFNLVNLYAKHYNSSTAATDPGVPMYEIAATLPPLNRKSVKEVYDYIIKELNESIGNLPQDNGRYKHRPTSTAVNALLARTYLYMGDYTSALKYSDQVLKVKNYLYDFNSTDFATGKYINSLKGISKTNDEEMILHKTSGGVLANIMYLDIDSFNGLYTDYSFNETDSVYTNHDLRRSYFFTGFVTSGEDEGKILDNTKKMRFYFTGNGYRYKLDGNRGGSQTNLPISTPEMYLIRAECNARLGNTQDALNDINTILVKRYSTDHYNELSMRDFNNDKTKILDRVLLERRRELYGHEMRLYDIKRLELPITKKLSSATIQFPANDSRLVWPIFKKYLELNPELKDNDRSQSGIKITK